MTMGNSLNVDQKVWSFHHNSCMFAGGHESIGMWLGDAERINSVRTNWEEIRD